MNVKQLATFCRVAEARSLSRAALATDVAQSLVSRQISQLEEEWGGRLFDRTGRGMELSEFGHRMYPEALRVLAQFNSLTTMANDAAGVLTGTVHLGVLPSMSRQLLPLLFADIKARAPQVRLHVTEGFSGSLDEQLASGKVDMAVINRYGISAHRGEDTLGRIETCLIGQPETDGGIYLSASTVPFKSLAGLPLVLPSAPNGLRAVIDQHSRRQGCEIDVVMEVETSAAMKDVALSGLAYTMLPRMAVAEEIAAGKLVAVDIVKPAIRRTISLSLTRQRPLSGAGRLVASRLKDLVPALLQ